MKILIIDFIQPNHFKILFQHINIKIVSYLKSFLFILSLQNLVYILHLITLIQSSHISRAEQTHVASGYPSGQPAVLCVFLPVSSSPSMRIRPAHRGKQKRKSTESRPDCK